MANKYKYILLISMHDRPVVSEDLGQKYVGESEVHDIFEVWKVSEYYIAANPALSYQNIQQGNLDKCCVGEDGGGASTPTILPSAPSS